MQSGVSIALWRVVVAVIRLAARFREDRLHDAEAIGTHGHAADCRRGNLCAPLTTDSAAGSLGWWLAQREPSNSLPNAAVAKVDVRAGDHVSHLGFHAAAGGAASRTPESGTETSGDACSHFRVALHEACSSVLHRSASFVGSPSSALSRTASRVSRRATADAAHSPSRHSSVAISYLPPGRSRGSMSRSRCPRK